MQTLFFQAGAACKEHLHRHLKICLKLQGHQISHAAQSRHEDEKVDHYD